MKKICLIFVGLVLTQSACDLQPRVLAFPDTVGEFISARYPALLADPYAQPEIYNSAVSDYGVYASPKLYGSLSQDDDYVVYASVDDYIVPPQIQDENSHALYGQALVDNESVVSDDTLRVPEYKKADLASTDIIVQRGDTLYGLAKKHGTTVEQLANINNLDKPYTLSVGQRLHLSEDGSSDDVLHAKKTISGVATTTRVELQEISVAAGDTLYSLSRKYSIPVNDLAVMNKLSAPFNLHIGQKLRVPNLANAPVVQVSKANTPEKTISVTQDVAVSKQDKTVADVKQVKTVKTEPKKISSDPSKKLPAISARSSSKFAWPVRGKILSAYGAKSNGLFNDGINISAARGNAVNAAENGVVAYAGNEVKGMGNLVIIQHSGGWMTVYAHMDSMNVRRGTRVNVGQKIGTVGQTGKVDSPQLHFEIRKGTKAYNPSVYLKK